MSDATTVPTVINSTINGTAGTQKKKKAKKQTNVTTSNVNTSGSTSHSEKIVNAQETLIEGVPDTSLPKTEDIFTIYVKSLSGSTLKLQISKADSTIEIKQLLAESIETCYITSYELKINDVVLEDFSDISEYEGIEPDATLVMHSALYDDKGARMHVYRMRELLDSKIDELYLSTGSIESAATTQVASFPSFASLVPFEPYNDLASALNCDTEFQTYSTNTDEVITKKKKSKKEQTAPIPSNINVIEYASTPEQQDTKKLFAPEDFSLKSLDSYIQATAGRPLPKCVNHITFSGWNPPPGNRKLRGDLFYLEIETLEGKQFHITATPNGFFINSTKNQSQFVPTPIGGGKQYSSHTLMGLLWEISPLFRKEFPKLLTARIKKHPFEVTPVPFPVPKWADIQKKHEYDPNRSEETLFTILGNDPRTQQREWNEEYQSCKELPSGTMEEKIIRDRTLFKIHCDFVDAATRGAQAVVDKCLLPVNPIDPESSQVYIQNNIFFSFADDNYKADPIQEQKPKRRIKDLQEPTATPLDPHAYHNANNDLKGVIAFNEADVRGIHTLSSAIIDYRGYRVIAQSIIPGILQGDQGSKHVYGSIDDGKSFAHDEKYHELMTEVSKKLGIKEHNVIDKEGVQHKICCPAECKGIVGSDGRFYVLDLVRTTPRDVNFLDSQTAIVRPELVKAYARHKFTESLLGNAENIIKNNTNPEEVVEMDIKFNPDVFSTHKLAGDEEQIKADENEVRELGKYLKEDVIRSFIKEVSDLEVNPLDGVSLTNSLHEKGINVRYLGEIATRAKASGVPHLVQLAEQEMIVRAAKHEFNLMLRKTQDDKLGYAIEHFLNAFFVSVPTDTSTEAPATTETTPVDEPNKKKSKKGPLAHLQQYGSNTTQYYTTITGRILRDSIIAAVSSKYRYTLTEETMNFFSKKISTLRSFCLKTGLKLSCRDYKLGSVEDSSGHHPFSINDILALEPVVKHSTPRSMAANGLLEVGKQQLISGQMESAFEFLSQAIVMFQQVKGPMNREVASCFSYLATILFHASDLPQAILHQHKALIISKRVLGIDSAVTCQIHQLLGMLCHNVGQSEFGLKHFLRARYLCELVCGFDHPDMATIMTNISMMYQDMNDTQRSVKFLREALRINETILGATHVQTAQSHHALAVTYSMDKRFRDAIEHERKSYRILCENFGDKDQRALESGKWLQHFTVSAVHQQQEINQEEKLTSQALRSITSLVKQQGVTVNPQQQREILQRMPQEILEMLNQQAQQFVSTEQTGTDVNTNTGAKPEATPKVNTTAKKPKSKQKKK
jgi:protein TIF31